MVLHKICYKGKGTSDFERSLPGLRSFSYWGGGQNLSWHKKGLRVNLIFVNQIVILKDFSLCVSRRFVVNEFQKLCFRFYVCTRLSLSFTYHPNFPGQVCFKNNEVDIHGVFIHVFIVPVSGYSIQCTKPQYLWILL